MQRRNNRRAEAGFTLVELLVVMVILGLLAALALPNVLGRLRGAKVGAAKTQISAFASAVEAFALDVGRYPTEAEGLDALISQPSSAATWDGPYIKKKNVPKDPWGNPYHYTDQGSTGDFEITSMGSDGRTGGTSDATDISSSD